jgi:peroxiredoxin
MGVDRDELQAAIDAAEARFLAHWTTGPQVTRWEELPVQVGDAAPRFVLPDQHGQPISLDEAVRDRPTVLVFWRHFGCGCGLDRAERLRAELPTFRSAGVGVLVIGQGVPVQAAAYAEEQELDVPVLTDPDARVYRAYGLLDGQFPQLLFDAPGSMWSCSPETAQGFVESRRTAGRRLVDNPWILPGEFVVSPTGSILHAHRYQHCEDYPDHRVLVTAATGTALEA